MTQSVQAANGAALCFQATTFDVVSRDGQLWLRSPQIAVSLGYSREDRVNELYSRNAAEFTDSMTAVVKLPTAGGVQDVRIFSLRGAHLLGMFARTARAAEFRRWVLDILDQQTQPPATISTEQQYQIKKAIEGKCMSNGSHYRMLYSRLYDTFKVPGYKAIAAADFERALEFIDRWQPPRGFDPAITCDNPQPQPPVMPTNPFGERLRWEIIDEGDGNIRCRLLDSSHKLIQYERLPGIIRDPNSELPYIVIRELLDACVDRMEQIITNSNAACDLLRTQLRRERGLN